MQVLNSNSRNLRNKENRGSSPSKEMQKLKIQLNDRIFQYHRLEEDFAQEKSKLVIDFQKERAYLNKTIKELKDKNQSDTEDWTNKIDEMRAEKVEALKIQLKEHEYQLKEHQLRIKTEIQKEFKLEISSLKNSLSDSQKQLQKKSQEWKKEKEEIISSLTNLFAKKEEELGKGYQAIIEGMKKDYEERLNKVQYLFIQEQETRKKIQKHLEDKIREHSKQIIIQEGINAQLTRENEGLKDQISNLQNSISKMKSQLDFMLKSYQEEKKVKADHYMEELNKAKIVHNKQNQQIIEIHSQHVMQLKSQISALQAIYREKERLWDERGRKLLELYQKRESKKQDMRAIETLQVELIKKDFMLEKERSQLKHCKLQLENMEQIYDKMFVSNNYLCKIKAKSFKVKKMKTTLHNSSNRSIIENRKTTFEDSK